MKNSPKKLLALLTANVIALSAGQALQIRSLVLFALIMMVYIVVMNYKKNFVNIMLFYLPFAPILKITPTDFSFFTIALMAVICIFSYRIRFNYGIRSYLLGACLAFLTFSSKLILGYPLTLDYIAFIATFMFLPTFVKLHGGDIKFEKNTLFFASGIIIACLTSLLLKNSLTMQAYIYVYEWTKVDLIRFSGFYGDSNYYAAQILAAISCLLLLITPIKNKNKLVYFLMIIALIFFGLLSVSKMFLFTLATILAVWLIAQARIQGLFWQRILAIICIVTVCGTVIATGAIKSGISMYATRFDMTDSASSLTTGRSDIVANYIQFFLSNPYSLSLGQGFSEVYKVAVDNRAAHNTPIQLIYQFGIVGAGLLLFWLRGLRKTFENQRTAISIGGAYLYLLLTAGVFMSWLSLDMLFLDDFFFFVLLFLSGVVYIRLLDNTTRKKSL